MCKVSIPQNFNPSESLLRAVWPENKKPDFWTNGRLSSAALKDRNGLSVSRTWDRGLNEAILTMKQSFHGRIVSISVADCNTVNACIKYKPSKNDIYHSEIWSSQDVALLDDLQAFLLARKAKIVSE